MTDARALAIVRIALGVIFLVRTRGPLLGWPDGRFHVALFPLPVWLVVSLVIVRTIAALAFTAGFRARIAGVIASACAYVVLSQDALAYINTFHLLFLSTFLVAVAGSSGVWLVRAIPMSVYFFSGIAKLNAQFLSGRALLWTCADGFVRGPVAGVVCASSSRAHACSIALVVLELALPVLLFVSRTRRVGLVLAFGFHALLEIAMHPDMFGWIMTALLIAFIPVLRRGRGRSHT